MRVSVDPNDAGYPRWRFALLENRRTVVFLDDAEIKGVTTADEEEGLAIVLALDAAGQLIIEDGAIKMETRRGRVRIEFMDAC